MQLFDNGKPCSLDEWLGSPERVLKILQVPRTSMEVNRLRWGSYVDMRIDVEDLKACRRRGLVSFDSKTKKWAIVPPFELSGCGAVRLDEKLDMMNLRSI